MNTVAASVALILLAGCSILKPAPPPDTPDDARRLIASITRQNNELDRFKGMGTAYMSRRDGGRQTARVAWIADTPDKLRLSVLDIAGLPLATMAADGEHFFMAAHAPKKKYFKTRAANPSLKKMIDVDVRAREIIAVLGGRVPMREWDHARVEADAGTGDPVLVLNSRRGRVVERIHLSGDLKTVRSVEMFDASGRRMYTWTFSRLQELEGGFSVPFDIDISDGEAHLRLKIRRFWPDAAAAPSTFSLSESEI
jgi:hypothetical protein